MNLISKIKHCANIMGLSRSNVVVDDSRSHKIVAVIDCILNQNSRDLGAATYPAMNKSVVQLCMQYNVGILPIPCPEMAFLGLLRNRPKGKSIKQALDTEAGRQCCREISRKLADKIQDYIKNNNQILAVLGGNTESPGCAVHFLNEPNERQALAFQSGVLMRELDKELKKREIQIPFRGIRDCNPELMKKDLEWLEKLFGSC